MTISDSIQEHIASKMPIGKRYLLAASGGLDSMVLWHVLHTLEYKIIVAHCNYQLRQNDSDADEALVLGTGTQRNTTTCTTKFDTKAQMQAMGTGLQETARNLRYTYFAKLQALHHCDYIVTAHHANDNIETVLMRIGRGTGLKGLCGIPEKNATVIRPLLPFTRLQLEEYATLHDIVWRQDLSNLSNDYLRNALRNKLIPLWKQEQEQLITQMVANISRWQSTYQLYQTQVEKIKKRIFFTDADGNHRIAIRGLIASSHQDLLLHEILSDFGASTGQIMEVSKLIDAHSGSTINLPKYRVIKHGAFLYITTSNPINSALHIIHDSDKCTQFELGSLHLDVGHFKINTSIDTAYLDAQKLAFPLQLRVQKAGDYFYPLGLGKKKKIARFMIDRKIPLHKKQQVWILESAGKIVWIVGLQLDDRFKVTDNTKQTLRIVLKDHNLA
jgi:tRNA(Ile)-lysidine synthase